VNRRWANKRSCRYSITSSASASNGGGISRPNCGHRAKRGTKRIGSE
jgi:hypothetical protein